MTTDPIHIDAPASRAFSIQRGADVALQLQFKDADGVVIDLTGHTWDSDFETMDGTALADAFAIDSASQATGRITLSVSRTVTADSSKMPDRFRHKLWSTSGGGLRRLWWYGTIQMRG